MIGSWLLASLGFITALAPAKWHSGRGFWFFAPKEAPSQCLCRFFAQRWWFMWWLGGFFGGDLVGFLNFCLFLFDRSSERVFLLWSLNVWWYFLGGFLGFLDCTWILCWQSPVVIAFLQAVFVLIENLIGEKAQKGKPWFQRMSDEALGFFENCVLHL